MLKSLPYIIILILLSVIAIGYYSIDPQGDDMGGDTLYLPVDSAKIISSALVGKITGTEDELVERFGKIIKDTKWSYSTREDTNWYDSTYIDTIRYTIQTLAANDSLEYSGYNLLDEDTLRASLMVRVNTLALLEPVNAIQNTIVIEGLTITVPERPRPSLSELAIEYWEWLALAFGVGYIIGN